MALFLLAALLRFYYIDAQSLWSDEGNSVAMAPRAPLEIIQRTAQDIHPPLYYLTLHAWSRFVGTSVVAVRALSALFGVLTVALTAALGWRIGGWRVAFFATLAAALSPFAIHYSQETRMYIMVTMLGAASWLAFSRGVRARMANLGLVFYFFITLALIYTHYYAVSVVVAQNVAWLWATIRARRWDGWWWVRWIGVQAAIVGAYVPWIWYARETILNWPSISEEITLSFIASETFRIFSLGLANDGMTWWAAAGFGLLLASGMIVALRGGGAEGDAPEEGRSASQGVAPTRLRELPLFYFLVPPALMLILSLDRPFWNPKFLLLALPGYHLLLGMGAAGLMGWLERSNRPLRVALGAGIAAFLLLAAREPLQNEYWEPRFWRDDYRAMVRIIEAQASERDAVLLDGAGQREVFEYYFKRDLSRYGLPGTQPLNEMATREQLEEMAAQHERLFVLWWAEQEGDPELFIPRWLDKHAFEAGSRWFGNVRLATYRLGELPPPAPLDVLFALPPPPEGESQAQLQLAGASIEPQTVVSGDVIAINSLWSAPNKVDVPVTFFAQLLDPANHVVGQYDGDGGAPPVQEWPPAGLRAAELGGSEGGLGTESGLQVIRMGIPVAVGTPPGEYALIMGAYRGDNGQRFVHPDGDAYRVASVRVEAPIVPPTIDALGLPHNQIRDVTFGDITLVGARANKLGFDHAPDTPLAPGEPVSLLLFWRAERAAPNTMPLTLRLDEPSGNTIAEWPLEPTETRHPLPQWTHHELVRDPQIRFLPGNTPPGTYRLTLQAQGEAAQALVAELTVR